MGFYVMRQDASIEGSAAVAGLPDSMDALEWMQGKGAALAPGTQLVLELAPGSGDYRGHLLEGVATLFHEDLKDVLDAQGVDNVIYFPSGCETPTTVRPRVATSSHASPACSTASTCSEAR